jgi:preprotein translocase subunit SecE
VARNRKRAKERRTRRASSAVGRPALAAAEGAPDPIEHAAPDVELADAQLALGRPELVDAGDAEAAEEEYELQVADGDGGGGGRRPRARALADAGGGGESGGGGVLLPAGDVPGGVPVAHSRVGLISRLIGFLQGSWRELQRVQWPDRRQVVQATGVVIGFVIVAGLFLALADLVASHLVTFILK